MAYFRLEAEFDIETNRYYVEIFYPGESTKPLIRTKAKYASKDAALNEAMVAIGRAFTRRIKLPAGG